MTTSILVGNGIKTLIEPTAKRIGEALANKLELTASIVKNDLIDPFQKYIENSIRNYEKLQTIINHSTPIHINDIYTPLTIERDNKSETITQFPAIILEENIFIIDTAGMGKSTLAKKIFLECWSSQKLVPIFIELRRLSGKSRITDYITNQVNLYSPGKKFKEEYIAYLCERGDFLLIFDGLDEVKDDEKNLVIESINQFTTTFHNSKYLLTSRDEPHVNSLKNFNAYRIRPLEEEEAFELIRKFDPSNKISKDLIEKLQEQIKHYSDFIKNPLLTTLLYKAYEYKQRVPLKKHIFYRQVFDSLFEGHDLTKDGFEREKKTNLDIDEFESACRAIGLISMKEQQIEFTRDEFNTLAMRIPNIAPQKHISPADLLADLTNSVPIFCKDGNNYRWVHRSMQEYFAALALHRDISKDSEVVLKIMSNDASEYYTNTISLYYDIDRKKFRNNIALKIISEFSTTYQNTVNQLEENCQISKRMAEDRLEITSLTEFVILDKEYDLTDDNNEKNEINKIFSFAMKINPTWHGLAHSKSPSNLISIFPCSQNIALHSLAKLSEFQGIVERIAQSDTQFNFAIDHPPGRFTNNPSYKCNSKQMFSKTTTQLKNVNHLRIDMEHIEKLQKDLLDENMKSISYTDILSDLY